MLIFALQQVLAVLAATIAVPTIIGIPTQIPAAIFGAGVGTAILIAGIGGLAIQIPYAFADADGVQAVSACIQVTSVATALILGIITNAVLTKIENKKEK